MTRARIPAAAPVAPFLIPLLVLVLLSACGRGGNDETGADADLRPRVQALPLAEALQAQVLAAPASVLSPNESQLSADVSARVARVHADVGSTVSEGDLILELDATDYRLALAQAEARVSAARARVALATQRLERARSLAAQRFVSEDEVAALQTEAQAATADADVAEADRRVAARNVEKCRITAPFDGVVLERSAQVGTLAPAGSPLVRLIDLAPAEVEAALQAADADALGQARDLVFETQGQRHPLRLLRLAPVVERSARTRTARFAFTASAAPAGSTGSLRWELPARQLPARLLVRRGEALGVFVVDDGTARFVAAPGATEGRAFSVDLPSDAWVVVEGQQGLSEGEAVRVAGRDEEA